MEESWRHIVSAKQDKQQYCSMSIYMYEEEQAQFQMAARRRGYDAMAEPDGYIGTPNWVAVPISWHK